MISAERNKERTSGSKGQMILLVYVRAEARTWSFYISGAANWPAEDILPYLDQRTA
jgi:hypothetical protein